jgi:hypothetical protein
MSSFSIYSPEEEYKSYLQLQIDLAKRFKTLDEVKILQEALEKGLEYLQDGVF